jgi:hypothetical protein
MHWNTKFRVGNTMLRDGIWCGRAYDNQLKIVTIVEKQGCFDAILDAILRCQSLKILY